MEKKICRCKGCGVVLQYDNPDEAGYSPKTDSDYCRRCFRLMHYDDLTVSMRKGIDPDTVLSTIEKMDSCVVYVVDLFDFEAGMIPGVNRRLSGKDILLVLTKRDLLPDTLSSQKLAKFVEERLKEYGVSIKGLVVTSSFDDETGIDEVRSAIHTFAKGRTAVFMGRANAGKSTLLNRLMGRDILTMSYHPGTTLDFNSMKMGDLTVVDTPGIEVTGSVLALAKEEDLKTILPYKRVRATVYQLKDDQSFAIGGLARMDLTGCDKASVVFYLSDSMMIHRGKLENADAFWKSHEGTLKPYIEGAKMRRSTVGKNMEKMDIVIDGLGWASLHGTMKTIAVSVPESVNVTFRKAML